jgi:hypothetical protein
MGNSNELYEQQEHDERHAKLRHLRRLQEEAVAVAERLEAWADKAIDMDEVQTTALRLFATRLRKAASGESRP